MFKIKSLEISNFIKYKGQTIDLDNQGIVLLQGDNRDEPKRGSSGSGKTIIGDAIHWLLSGKTTRNILSDRVIGKFGKSCYVGAKIELDGKEIEVIRYRKDKKYGNSLRIITGDSDVAHRNIDETQERLERSILGCSFNLFRISQFYNSDDKYHFSKMSSQARAKIFDEIIGTDEAKVGNRIKVLSKWVDKEKELLEKLEDEEKNINYGMNELLNFSKSFKQVIDNHKKGLENLINDKNIEIEDIRSKLKRDYKSELITANEEYKKYSSDKKSIDDIKNTLLKEIEDRMKECLFKIKDLRMKVSDLHHINYATEQKCSRCGGNVNRSNIEMLIAENNKIESSYEGDINRNTLLYQKDEIELKKIKKQINDFDSSRDSYFIGKIKTLEIGVNNIETYKDEIKCLEEDIKEYKEKNLLTIANYEKQLKENTDKINNNYNRLKEIIIRKRYIQGKIDNIETLLEFYGPQGYLPLIFKSYSPLLSDLANNYLNKFMGGTDRIKISSNTQLASGEIRNKVDISIIHGTDIKSFPEEYSRGESSAIDLSINMALMKLANEKAKKEFGFLFMDEALDGMSEKLIQQFFKVFKEEIHKPGHTSIITTHRSLKTELDFIKFDKTLTAVKENGICQII